MPTMTVAGTCYDGNCVEIAECWDVPTCDVCTGDNICVQDIGIVSRAHCVKKPYTCPATSSYCSCFSSLCNGLSCADRANGMNCGSG
jgi:hypothetical protein